MFAAACVVLSAAGHLLASCADVPLWTLGLGFLLVLAVAVPLAGRERTLTGIVTSLVAGQIALHTLFGVGQQDSARSAADADLVAQAGRLTCGGDATMSPLRAHQILSAAGIDPQAGHAAHQHGAGAASLLPSLPMLLAHLLAAAVTGWLLRRGDMALFRLVQLSAQGRDELLAQGAPVRALRAALALVRALLAGLPWAPDCGPSRPHTELQPRPRPRTTTLQHTVIRRGPPTGAPLALAA